MSTSNPPKISFSFGSSKTSSSTPLPPPATSQPSNLELLMAKAKSSSSSTSTSIPRKKPPIPFPDPEEDEPPLPPSTTPHGPTTKKSNTSNRAGPSNLLGPNGKNAKSGETLLSRSERKAQQDALSLDPTAFEYDQVYDQLKASERAAEQLKKIEAEERKPRYIENFLASAQTRRLDRLRAEEKMLQLEREKEGDEFDDKEKFVTEAYKKQMEEVRKAEEEERVREENLRKSKKGPGLSAFYKTMLDDSAAKHAAAMSSTSTLNNPSSTPGPSLTIKPPSKKDETYEPEAEYDPFLARQSLQSDDNPSGPNPITNDMKMGPSRPSDEERAAEASSKSGKRVEFNDDGEIVDNRSLLKAGLNITKKQTVLPTSLLTGGKSQSIDGPYISRAVGTAASYEERMVREKKRLAEQMREDKMRREKEREEMILKEEEEARKRREGDDGEAERRRKEAKERFLARKRAREVEEDEENKRAKDDS
ncbi:hypothetical protein M231_04986 [Tremella mesenterica]|uniref:Nuclear speckle splicing regulatory protein 1 N-terminal domain-containing protein n=1 Tax=Tremella mesenterica TaxID=5217 RepID=A0A4V1M3R0_TREME|nr:hypothetical protein M231_04986 [Tremella mesenterica]